MTSTAAINALIGPPDTLYLSKRRRRLMRALAGDAPKPADGLCEQLGINYANLMVLISKLRPDLWPRGYDIENVRGHGYRLVREDI